MVRFSKTLNPKPQTLNPNPPDQVHELRGCSEGVGSGGFGGGGGVVRDSLYPKP